MPKDAFIFEEPKESKNKLISQKNHWLKICNQLSDDTLNCELDITFTPPPKSFLLGRSNSGQKPRTVLYHLFGFFDLPLDNTDTFSGAQRAKPAYRATRGFMEEPTNRSGFQSISLSSPLSRYPHKYFLTNLNTAGRVR